MVYELPENLFQATVRLVGKLSCETAADLYLALVSLQPQPERPVPPDEASAA